MAGREESKDAASELGEMASPFGLLQDTDIALKWSKVESMAGDVPGPRSGHTLSVVGDEALLFGGLDPALKEFTKPNGKTEKRPGPNSDLYRAKLPAAGSTAAVRWVKVATSQSPPPRYGHTATVVGENRLLIFGGFASSSQRYADVHVLNTKKLTWHQPIPPAYTFDDNGNHIRTKEASKLGEPPAPRGGHSATLLHGKVYVFGGYGGEGFARKDFNDMHVFSASSRDIKWSLIPVKERTPVPPPRSAHSAVAVKDVILVHGGWNAKAQYSDVWAFDTQTNLWSCIDPSHGAPRWGHAALAIEAIPTWKMLVFGGNLGDTGERARVQGSFTSRIDVYDNLGPSSEVVVTRNPNKTEDDEGAASGAGTPSGGGPVSNGGVRDVASNASWQPSVNVEGDVPSARSNTPAAYDAANSRVVVFGGWSNRWLDGMYTLDLSGLVGPPYAVLDIEPASGPVTGGQAVTIHGEGFLPDQEIVVRFSRKSGAHEEAIARYVSPTRVVVDSPPFDRLGSGMTQLRLRQGMNGLTNTYQEYSFHSVTDASTTLAFGSGVLEGGVVDAPAYVIIQARDSENMPRTTGEDQFNVNVRWAPTNEFPGQYALDAQSEAASVAEGKASESKGDVESKHAEEDGPLKFPMAPPSAMPIEVGAPLTGLLTVHIHRGKELQMNAAAAAGEDGAIDPYLAVGVGAKPAGDLLKYTHKVEDNASPVWDDVLTYKLDGHKTDDSQLRLIVVDKDDQAGAGDRDDFIGAGSLDLVTEVLANGGSVRERWVQMRGPGGSDAGQVQLSASFVPAGASVKGDATTAAGAFNALANLEGSLAVRLVRASGLRQDGDSKNRPDPYVVLRVGLEGKGGAERSKTVQDSDAPEFNETVMLPLDKAGVAPSDADLRVIVMEDDSDAWFDRTDDFLGASWVTDLPHRLAVGGGVTEEFTVHLAGPKGENSGSVTLQVAHVPPGAAAPVAVPNGVVAEPAALAVTTAAAAPERTNTRRESTVGTLEDLDEEDEELWESVPNKVVDNLDGTYSVQYTPQKAGKYVVSIVFAGTFGGAEGTLRGAPFAAKFFPAVEGPDRLRAAMEAAMGQPPRGLNDVSIKDAGVQLNSVQGPLVAAGIKSDLRNMSTFIKTSLSGLQEDVPEDSVPTLMRVKEHLIAVNSRRDEVELTTEKVKAALAYRARLTEAEEGDGGRRLTAGDPILGRSVETSVARAEESWEEVQKQVPITKGAIQHLIKVHGASTRGDLGTFEQRVLRYAEATHKAAHWFWETGVEASRRSLQQSKQRHAAEWSAAKEREHVAIMFDMPDTLRKALAAMHTVDEELEYMVELWDLVEECSEYIATAKATLWKDVDPDALEEGAKALLRRVNQGLHASIKWSSAFKGLNTVVREFVSACPLILALRHPSMRLRHWHALAEATGKQFTPPPQDPTLKLEDLFSLQLHKFTGEVEEITDRAVKEANMETVLARLDATWAKVVWVQEPVGDGVTGVKLHEDEVEVLENDQMAVQAMVGSRYRASFEEEISGWQTKLTAVADVVGLLGDVGRIWKYLAPLFLQSAEVKTALPDAAKQFEQIDVAVRKVFAQAVKDEYVVPACNRAGTQSTLEEQQSKLEICRKALQAYLDDKRRIFPRFFFVSEADLLHLLSNGDQPRVVMKHLSKVMLATAALTMTGGEDSKERPTATEFVAGVGKEIVSFTKPLPLTGKAEAYLADVLEGQKQTLNSTLQRAYHAYTATRTDWLQELDDKGRSLHPAQIVVVVAAMKHYEATNAALEALTNGRPDALKTYNAQQTKDLTELIRITRTDLSKEQRRRVMVMITQDSHNRDIIGQMIDRGVKDSDSFLWKSQLKHRWVTTNGGDCEITALNTVFPYGYEYLGNAARLVITPLTDRIYVTATQALYLKMGCAPAGPAGTGKTETTKDLASAMGKACYVFNCSPEMDFQSMGAIFAGLGASGSWGCFDEFNRLVPEVLSVCSVQFKALCDAVRENKETLTIESTTVKVDRSAGTAGVFITMNPGYLGRSELPEGLKALFRPITVMVPDLVLICENFLQAEGFEDAKVLARKFYGLYSLLSELLSPQSHYDWGLRAVKSVLVVAGAFKRAEPELDEQTLLMRALRDFNTPKIVQEDRVIFFGLLEDLFPGVDPPRQRNPELEQAVVAAAKTDGLHASEEFCLKCVQLDELLEIRHSVFLLGPPGCGKSATWKTLQTARKSIHRPTSVRDLNPKAVSPPELYGHVVLATRDWRDGLLPIIMREMGEIPDEEPKWLMLDGDLDANWIESMNSVMDDNKMLTLANNERIPLKDHMRMLFELRDLRFASPATVSRAGIIFISSATGYQWRALVESWIVASPYPASMVASLRVLFDTYLPEILLYHKKTLKALVHLEDTSLVSVFLEYLTSLLPKPGDAAKKHAADDAAAAAAASRRSPRARKKDKEDKGGAVDASAYYAPYMKLAEVVDVAESKEADEASAEPLDAADHTTLEYLFAFCAVWAFGSAAGDRDGVDWKREFSDWFKASFKGVRFSSRDSVFDFALDPDTHVFDSWKSSPLFYSVAFDSSTMDMASVYVPTPETVAVSFWARRLLDNGRPVMMAGAAGCGKTALLRGLVSQMDPEAVTSTTINFNFFTDAAALQATLEGTLDRKSGATYGPPGSRRMVFFLDDLNLPELDPYDTQSAIALVRQHIDYGHWYDRAKQFLKQVINTQYVAALNPTAGSFTINPRLQRHFATFAVNFPSSLSLLQIYSTFLDGHLASFSEEVQGISSHLLNGALGLHAAVAANFKKSATRSHYEFSVRHLSAVFQGLLTAQPAQFRESGKLVRLWLHESDRVYSDRLVSTEDQAKYRTLALNQAKKRFPAFNLSAYFASTGAEPLLFCHYAESRHDGVYDRVTSLETLTRTIGDALKEHNEVNSAMNLVLFGDAVRHITRISRVLKSPTAGHALLMGVGGSGKQSLARLAAFLCDMSISSIAVSATYTMTDFREDIKSLYFKTGVKQESVMFLLRDSQITQERFLVVLNDMLASGNVAGLYAQEDKDQITGDIAGKAKAAGLPTDKDTCWEFFMAQVRANLHVVLCFSPGEIFRERARKFPALISSTTIDWFHPWPEEALLSVGRRTLAEVPGLGTAKVRETIVQFMPFAFQAVNEVAERYAASDRRRAYTTPKSFLEGLKLYVTLLSNKRTELDSQLQRLTSGVDKLQDTQAEVATIEANLKVLLDSAEEKRSKAEAIADAVSAKAAQVEAETAGAQKEADACASIQVQVAAQAAETEQDLAAAEPLLEKAQKALNTLDQKDLGLCRQMQTPPPGVDDVFAAVAVLFAGVDPNVPVTKRGVVRDSDRAWDPVKRALLKETSGFLQNLLDYRTRIDNFDVPARNFSEVRPYLDLPHFNRDTMISKNPAAAGLCDFVINIVQYWDVLQVVQPKRDALAETTKKLNDATERLGEVQAKVAELEAALGELQMKQAAAEAERAGAQAEVDAGTRRLDLAQRLLRALGDEQERWCAGIERLKSEQGTLVGDVLVASAFVSFAGPFTARYRAELLNEYWVPFLAEPPSGAPVPLSDDFDPMVALSNEAEIAKWHAQGLPSDALSTQNGAITSNTSRWPLLLDPQLQGIKWVRKMEGHGLVVARMDQADLVHKLAAAVQDGRSMLLENLPASIDATLWPVITRATVKRGRRRVLMLGDRELDWNKNFKLYLHTKLSNPHYPPEVQAETTLINFTVTQAGLEEQLLDITVRKERRDLAAQRSALIRQQNRFTVKVKELEDSILAQLAAAEGDYTDDVALIESLENAKHLSISISEKMRIARTTQQQIAETAEQYRPVATRGALLFFLMDSLVNMHTYYVHSLSSFITVFLRGIDSVTDQEVDEEATAVAERKRKARSERAATAEARAAAEAEAEAAAVQARKEAELAAAKAAEEAAAAKVQKLVQRKAAAYTAVQEAAVAERKAASAAVAEVARDLPAAAVGSLKRLLTGAALQDLLKASEHRTTPAMRSVVGASRSVSQLRLPTQAVPAAVVAGKAVLGRFTETDTEKMGAALATALAGGELPEGNALVLADKYAGEVPGVATCAAASGSTYVRVPGLFSQWVAKVWMTLPATEAGAAAAGGDAESKDEDAPLVNAGGNTFALSLVGTGLKVYETPAESKDDDGEGKESEVPEDTKAVPSVCLQRLVLGDAAPAAHAQAVRINVGKKLVTKVKFAQDAPVACEALSGAVPTEQPVLVTIKCDGNGILHTTVSSSGVSPETVDVDALCFPGLSVVRDSGAFALVMNGSPASVHAVYVGENDEKLGAVTAIQGAWKGHTSVVGHRVPLVPLPPVRALDEALSPFAAAALEGILPERSMEAVASLPKDNAAMPALEFAGEPLTVALSGDALTAAASNGLGASGAVDIQDGSVTDPAHVSSIMKQLKQLSALGAGDAALVLGDAAKRLPVHETLNASSEGAAFVFANGAFLARKDGSGAWQEHSAEGEVVVGSAEFMPDSQDESVAEHAPSKTRVRFAASLAQRSVDGGEWEEYPVAEGKGRWMTHHPVPALQATLNGKASVTRLPSVEQNWSAAVWMTVHAAKEGAAASISVLGGGFVAYMANTPALHLLHADMQHSGKATLDVTASSHADIDGDATVAAEASVLKSRAQPTPAGGAPQAYTIVNDAEAKTLTFASPTAGGAPYTASYADWEDIEEVGLVVAGKGILLHAVYVGPSGGLAGSMFAAGDRPLVKQLAKSATAKAAAAAAPAAQAPATSLHDDDEDDDEELDDGPVYKVRVLDMEELPARAVQLKESVSGVMLQYVRQGLFEMDKLTVSTLLTLKVLVQEGVLDAAAARVLVRAEGVTDAANVGVLSDWMSQSTWGKVKGLETLVSAFPRFETLGEDMQLDSDKWQTWMESEKPEEAKLPGRHRSATPFERLLLLRAMRPDRLPTALRDWISTEMGEHYVNQPNFNMKTVWEQSSAHTPIFFVLFPGVDPTPWVQQLGAAQNITEDNGLFVNISMGQGQDGRAEGHLHRLAKEGGWIMLQNVHLMQEWLPRLERQLEIATETAHPNFRCFLSAEPPPLSYMKNMPESLMQNAIKIANEAPSDLRSNLLRAWGTFSDDTIETATSGDAKLVETFRPTLFTLCFFHAIVLGRRRFGFQGWSKRYSFNVGDLTICADILADYLRNYGGAVPWDDLRYLFGAIMYGGHITDFWDRRTNNTYLEVLFTPTVLHGGDLAPELAFTEVADTFQDPNATDRVVPGFAVPDASLNHGEVDAYIKDKLPPEQPKVYGLHPNSELNYLISSTDSLFSTIVVLEGADLFPSPQAAGDGKKKKKRRAAKKPAGGSGADVGVAAAGQVRAVIADIMKRLPEQFSMIDLQMRAEPLLLEEHGPYVVVALQECTRMNELLEEIRRSLDELTKGLDGQLNITAAMEDLASALAINQVPGRNPFHQISWEKLAWWSRRSLSSWFNDLLVRVAQLEEWSSALVLPLSVWLPGLFNPTAFLTAVQQVVARRNHFPLDGVTVETHVTTMEDASAVEDYPSDGAFVHGLFIEGARFSIRDEDGNLLDPYMENGVECAGYLAESRLKELLPPLPVVYVKAVEISTAWEPTSVGYLRHDKGLYEAPLYYTTARGPTYVMLSTLRSRDIVSKWVLAGVALVQQEDE